MDAAAAGFRLPFHGRWFVAQGGDTLNVNQHMSVRAQWFGLDFMKVGGSDGRALADTDEPATVAAYYSWGQEVLAPVDGTVQSVVDGLPDNALGTTDRKNPAGNHVVIAAGGRFVFLAHMQRGSLRVRPGQRLSARDVLGLCGNSGNTSAPHVHLHVQDTPVLNQGNGQNVTFDGVNVELSEKVFSGVSWPLIRGLFVWD